MLRKAKTLRGVVCVFLPAVILSGALSAAELSGETKEWHKVTLTFDGPWTSEKADPNPFLYYRLNVTFSHVEGGRSYVVGGYFAADGNAANTSANKGNKWRVHFAPDRAGIWEYSVSFRKGRNVAVSDDSDAGESAGFMDGQSGSFYVGPTDKSGRDFRGKGMLKYVGKHHLQFAETGEYFLKCGADAPENFLAYEGFDGDFKFDGHKDNFIKDWAPHIIDFEEGDPTWQDGKGKGIIGAVNYLARQGMNVFSFLTMNIGGDDRNVFPYISYDERLRMDVSRLDQWEIIFEHADKLGMYLHFKTLETENELLLDNGDLGVERKLYYRELISRFSHHLALNWNLGEEINDASTEQKVAWADYFWTHDPYQHHIVIHNGAPHYDMLGDASKLTGFSLQTSRPDFSQVHRRTLNYIERSVAAGKPWVVACDEPGDASHALITDAEDPTRDNPRKNALWGNIMAGGAGVEWYFGYKHPHSDLTCEDYRTREKMWNQCRYALEFFETYEIPFWDMSCQDELTANTDDYVFCKPGRVYLVYLKHGGEVGLDVASGSFAYGWFNPRTGDGLNGFLDSGLVEAGRAMELTCPDENDWLLVVQGSGVLSLSSEQPSARSAEPAADGTVVLKAVSNFEIDTENGFVPAYKDDGHGALAIDPGKYKDKYAAAETTFTGESGSYDITLTTLAETDGESAYKLFVGGEFLGEFTNPRTSEDYKPTLKTWSDVPVEKGEKIRVEFNSATNSRARQGNRKAYSRGRWTAVTFVPDNGGESPGNGETGNAEERNKFDFGKAGTTIFEESDGLVAAEAEHFAAQMMTEKRQWYITSVIKKPITTPDGDECHAESASGGAYIEVLPDTRRNHGHKLIRGENFSNEPGKMAILVYPVHFDTPGRYYVWVRAYSTGSEDNGLHVGLDGTWPASGQRLQWCEGKNSWRWESKQRTQKQHCGEPYKIYLDIENPGLHTIEFSMREDGFEFDKWLMTQDRDFRRPSGTGPSESILK
jgi:hypothetical protein